MPDIQEQLRLAQARVKALSSRRDQVIRDAGIEEQKLQHLYDTLRQLGVSDPEALSEDKLRELAALTQKELEDNLKGLAEALAKGEELLKEYETLQQGG
jgi:hypothetical protein